jgi:WD40 repeat protein/tetratricopeptide (TPR) repeat protein
VRVWNVQDGRQLGVLRGHKHWVLDVDWRPDGKQLASVGADGELKVWDWPAPQNPTSLASGLKHGQELMWNDDSSTLAIASDRIEFRDAASLDLRLAVDVGPGALERVHSPNVSWRPSSRLVAAHREKKTVLLDDRSGELRLEIPDSDQKVCAIALHPQGKKIATSGWNATESNGDSGTVRVFDTTSGTELWKATGDVAFAGCLRWNFDDSRLACGCWGGALIVDGEDGTVVQQVGGAYELGWINSLAWNPDGDRLAIAHWNHLVRVIDVTTGQETKVLVGHTAPVNAVSWNPDGSRIASCGEDGTVRVWNAATGAQMIVLRCPENMLESVAWSPDGMSLAAVDGQGELRIWNATVSLARNGSPQLLARLDRRLEAEPDLIDERRLRLKINERLGNVEAAGQDRQHLRQSFQKRLQHDPTNADIAGELAELLAGAAAAPEWQPLQTTELAADPSGKLLALPDGSILSEPISATGESGYRMVCRSPVRRVTALRLETLPHSSLPSFGQGWDAGNFHLSELRAEVRHGSEEPVPLSFRSATSDWVRPLDESTTLLDGPWAAIDRDHSTTWNIWPEINSAHWLALEFSEPVELAETDELIVYLDFHLRNFWHARLGRFRVSVTGDKYDSFREELLLAIRQRSLSGFEALAGAYLIEGDADRAAECLSSAAASGSAGKPLEHWTLQARVARHQGDLDAAQASTRQLVEVLKKQSPPRALQALLFQTAGELAGLTPPQLKNLLEQSAIDGELARLKLDIEADPTSAAKRLQRGALLARLGRWRECAQDYVEAARLSPDNRINWGIASTPLILAGDVEGYKQHCKNMRNQFRDTTAAEVADTVCKANLLLPAAVELSELPIQILRDGTSDPVWVHYRPWFVACCALISYREGDPAKAIEWTSEMPSLAGHPGALALVVRAMSEEKMGRHEQAFNRWPKLKC